MCCQIEVIHSIACSTKFVQGRLTEETFLSMKQSKPCPQTKTTAEHTPSIMKMCHKGFSVKTSPQKPLTLRHSAHPSNIAGLFAAAELAELIWSIMKFCSVCTRFEVQNVSSPWAV